MKRKTLAASLAAGTLLLGACATVPSGPNVLVLPGSTKSFDQFRLDDLDCRQYASDQVGGATAQQSANDAAARSALIGTAIGALAGAALGGGDRYTTGVGAGFGLLTGAAVGSGAAAASAGSTQQRYDNAFQQCMYARGHKVPVAAGSQPPAKRYSRSYYPPPPPPSTN